MIDKNDPRLTAYVMGELDASDSAEIAAALKKSPELQAAVKEIQLVTDLTGEAFASQPQLQLTPEQKNELLVAASQAQASILESPSIATTRRPWLPIAIAASLLGLMVGGAFYLKSQNAMNGNRSVAKTDAEPESDASTVTVQPDAEVVASKENARSSLKQSAQAADELQPPMAIDQAFAMGSSLESNQHLAAKDLAMGDSKSKLRYSKDSSTGVLSRSLAKSQKPNLAQEMDSSEFQEQLLKSQQENVTAADKLVDKVARAPGAGLKGKTLPSESLDKAELASGKHSADGQPALSGMLEDQELQLAQQTIARSDLASLGIKLTRQRRNKRRQSTVIELSEEQADQIVLLLANRFDPGSERQLSFAELVGPTAPKNPAASVQLAPAAPPIDARTKDIDSEATAASLSDKASAGIANEGRTQTAKSIAATQLASAIRRFQQQQDVSDEEKLDAVMPLDAQRRIVSGSGAAAMRSDENPIASAPVTPDAANTAKKLQSTSQNSFAAPAIARQDMATRFNSQSLEKLDIDYTDLIQQLKRCLLKRNAEVRRLRTPSEPTQD